MIRENIIQVLNSLLKEIDGFKINQNDYNYKNSISSLFEEIFEILDKSVFINVEDIKLHDIKEKLLRKHHISENFSQIKTIINKYLKIITSSTEWYFPSSKMEKINDLIFSNSEINFKNLSIYIEDLIERLERIKEQGKSLRILFFD